MRDNYLLYCMGWCEARLAAVEDIWRIFGRYLEEIIKTLIRRLIKDLLIPYAFRRLIKDLLIPEALFQEKNCIPALLFYEGFGSLLREKTIPEKLISQKHNVFPRA